VAVVAVVVFGYEPGPRSFRTTSVGDCLTVQHKEIGCKQPGAWYRVASETSTPGSCSGDDAHFTDGGDHYCLDRLHPIKIDIDVPPLDIGGDASPKPRGRLSA
jgi:hypothetical protein